MHEHRSAIGGTLLGAAALAWISDAVMVGNAANQRFDGPISLGLIAAGAACLVGALVAFGALPRPIAKRSRKLAWYAGEYLHGQHPTAPSQEAAAELAGQLAELGRPAEQHLMPSVPFLSAVRAIRAEVLENLQAASQYVDALKRLPEDRGLTYAAGFRFNAAVWKSLGPVLALDADLFDVVANAYREADRANQHIAWRETQATGLFGVNRKVDDLPAVRAAFQEAADALAMAQGESPEAPGSGLTIGTPTRVSGDSRTRRVVDRRMRIIVEADRVDLRVDVGGSATSAGVACEVTGPTRMTYRAVASPQPRRHNPLGLALASEVLGPQEAILRYPHDFPYAPADLWPGLYEVAWEVPGPLGMSAQRITGEFFVAASMAASSGTHT